VMGRLTQVTDALSNSQSWTYDAAGLTLTATDQFGHVTSMTYDAYSRGLPVLQSDALGTPVQSTRLFTFDADGRPSTPRDTDGYTTSKGYDAQGNQVQVTNYLGGVQRASYDLANQLTGFRDELGRWTFYQYNSRGWVAAVDRRAGQHDQLRLRPGRQPDQRDRSTEPHRHVPVRCPQPPDGGDGPLEPQRHDHL